jgi:hypothetical protein
MSANDPTKPSSPADFPFGAISARSGGSTHQSGWQDAAPKVRDVAPAPFGSAHAARPAPEGTIVREPLAEQLRRRVAQHGDPHAATPATSATPPTDSPLARVYARNGGSTHRSGWQEPAPVVRDAVAPPFGTQRMARAAPAESISRLSIAERLRRRVTQHKEQ